MAHKYFQGLKKIKRRDIKTFKTEKQDEEVIEYGVPIIVDDVKIYPNFSMTRCTYFTIESETTAPGWVLTMAGKNIPFFLTGISGVITQPLDDDPLFDSVSQIDDLFDIIEEISTLYIDTNDIWLPNFLFEPPPRRSEVYRVKSELFAAAHLFRDHKIMEDEFLEICEKQKEAIYLSEKESESFRSWEKNQVNLARDIYPKDKSLELEWREQGTT